MEGYFPSPLMRYVQSTGCTCYTQFHLTNLQKSPIIPIMTEHVNGMCLMLSGMFLQKVQGGELSITMFCNFSYVQYFLCRVLKWIYLTEKSSLI